MASTWGQWLQKLEDLSAAPVGLDCGCREARDFASHFRVSYDIFLFIMEAVKPVFSACTHDVAGRPCPPLKLKVLGALNVLASGVTFKDVAAMSGMSISTAETSFHHFCEKISEGLWETWVTLPVGDDLKKVEEIYRKCGLPGAVGSLDCTHFKWTTVRGQNTVSIPARRVIPLSWWRRCVTKLAASPRPPSRTPGAKNDQTVISRDQSVWRIRDEEPWKSMKYKLKNADGTETEYTGAWLIVDGGTQRFRCLSRRSKHTSPSRSMHGAGGWRAFARTSSAASA
ncbi:unnamed protein product [Ascophyllum nodosum]